MNIYDKIYNKPRKKRRKQKSTTFVYYLVPEGICNTDSVIAQRLKSSFTTSEQKIQTPTQTYNTDLQDIGEIN